MKKQHIQLSETERQELEQRRSTGKLSARQFNRATGLLALDRGETLEAVAALLGVTTETVRAWRERYRADGLKSLPDKPRSGRPVEFDGSQRAKITALACTEAPAGHSKWTLRLLAAKVVELDYCEHISHTQIHHVLKKTKSSPI